MRSAASAALCVSSVARSTPLRWNSSSCRRSRPTVGSTRSPTVTRSWPVRPAWQEDTGELPRAGGSEHPPKRRVALALPQPVPARRAVARVRGHEQRLPAYPPGPRPPARREVRVHLLPRRLELLPLPRADRDRRLPDVLLRPVGDAGVYEHPRDPEPGDVRITHEERPPVGRPPDGLLRLPAHDAGLLPRRLQAAARVQLGRRRGAAVPHDHAQLHRLPAAVGPDRVLGDHHRHQHGRLRAVVQHAHQAHPARRVGGGAEHVAALLRGPRHLPATDRSDLPGGPFLAYSQRRWDLGAAMTTHRGVTSARWLPVRRLVLASARGGTSLRPPNE